MTEKMKIEIEFSESATLTGTDENIDARASIINFRDSLVNHIYEVYPDADIAVTVGINDKIAVDGREDDDEIPYIENIIDVVWNSDSWMENAL